MFVLKSGPVAPMRYYMAVGSVPSGLDQRETAHTSGITTALILAHVEACGGRGAVGSVLRRIGMTEREAALRDERTWWSWDTKIALFEAAADVLGDPEVTFNAGRSALERNVAAPLKAALRALGSPSLVYSNIIRANHKFSTVSQMILEDMGGHRARVRYELVDEVEPHRLDCLYNQGLLGCVPQLFDLPAARIVHAECALRGAAECVYEVTWQPQVRARWRSVAGWGAAAAATVAAGTAIDPAAAVVAVTAGAGALGWLTSRKQGDLARAIARLERDIDISSERGDRIRGSLHALSSALEHDEVVGRITEYASQALGGYDCVLLLEQDGIRRVQSGPAVTPELRDRLELWAAGDVDALGATVAIDDLAGIPELGPLSRARPPVASLCASPLRAHGERLGLLVALAPRPHSFLPPELSIVELFAEQAAIALFNSRLYAAQQEMATRDPLTGLRNHREFHEAVESELARCRRSGARFSVALLDLDGFKGVNDTAGHAAGDQLLKDVGAALEASARGGDVPFRVGGDEFAVLLPESGPQEAEAAVQRIAATAAAVDSRVGVSWGVGTWPADGETKEQVLRRADELLYVMKRGRGDAIEDKLVRLVDELGAEAVAAALERLASGRQKR